MGSMTTMVEAANTTSSRSLMAVRMVGRALREAGQIPTGGRGMSARAVTPEDCAVLLIGLNAIDRQNAAGDAVQTMRRAVPWDGDEDNAVSRLGELVSGARDYARSDPGLRVELSNPPGEMVIVRQTGQRETYTVADYTTQDQRTVTSFGITTLLRMHESCTAPGPRRSRSKSFPPTLGLV